MMYFYFGSDADNVQINGEYDLTQFSAVQQKIQSSAITDFSPCLFFLKQTHSNHVHHLDAPLSDPLTAFQIEGDAIVTQEKNIAIGVVTADCLPLVLHDTRNHAIGVIHAGWRGLHANIISACISKMHTTFHTVSSDLQVYLGPSAAVCCYEVQSDFLSFFPEKDVIEKRDDLLFFNAKKTALLELATQGVADHQIDSTHHTCTICTPGFCSVRKSKNKAGRQPSIAMLV